MTAAAATLLLTHSAGLAHDMGEYHPECPDRLRVVLQALEHPDFVPLLREEAPEATAALLELAHPADYVRAILAIEPPPGGSVCRVVTFPPEQGRVSARDVQAFFDSMGSPGASTYSADAPHPYMQKTRTLDFCLVLEGEITLVLDLEEVPLKAGDTVVQRGTNHAWSNRSGRPCTVAFSSHDAQ